MRPHHMQNRAPLVRSGDQLADAVERGVLTARLLRDYGSFVGPVADQDRERRHEDHPHGKGSKKTLRPMPCRTPISPLGRVPIVFDGHYPAQKVPTTP